jgi:CRISPR/Cas system CSM-associated protein Csm3 (group 7 of RAMP superfamily)
MTSFREVVEMTEILVTITAKTPLYIGAGAQQGTLAQRGLLKDRDGWPYIPATSLKGKLRHAVEQLVSALSKGGPIPDPHENRALRPPDIDPPDMVSVLFGAPWLPGLVVFEDFHLVGPPALLEFKKNAPKNPRTTERTGVSINRRRKVAADQRLYRTEVFWPGAPLEFGGTLRGELSCSQAGLLVAGLRLVPALGGGKTGGLGWIAVDTEVRVDGQVWSDAEMLAAVKEGQ